MQPHRTCHRTHAPLKDMSQMDLSSAPNIPSELPGQIESTMVTYMDRQLFKAAEKGDMEPLNAYQDHLDRLVDADQNTALHIYSSASGEKTALSKGAYVYLRQLLEKCPSLLMQANARGEIPLHVAARYGQHAIVDFFINRSKEQHGGDLEQMLRMRDKEQNTALHKAAQYGRLNVVQALLIEDPDLSSSVNSRGETPLYVAARGGGRTYHHLVAKILDGNCEPMALVGPRGRTILHAAALANNAKIVKIILERKNHLAKEMDEDGWTPLHYAAHFGHLSVAKALLVCDSSTAYITNDKERGMSPLHMAAWQGDKKMMALIISNCPGCLGILDKGGWNFLHFALVTLPPRLFYNSFFLGAALISIIFQRGWTEEPYSEWTVESKTRNLLDEKDANGITPFHILLYGPARHCDGYDDVVSALKRKGLGAQIPHWDEYSQDSQNKKKIEEVLKDIGNINIAGKPVHHAFRENMEGKDSDTKTAKERIEKAMETHLLVATLVATVTFAAALTVPGGYKSDKGSAILSRNSAFKAFVITDSLSFICSLSAVFIHFSTVIFKQRQPKLTLAAFLLTFFAMFTMVIAFSTGLYAVLESSAIALAIAACSITVVMFFASYMFIAFVI